MTSQTIDEHQMEQFFALLLNESRKLKSDRVIRNMKKDIMYLVYKAQEDEEKVE